MRHFSSILGVTTALCILLAGAAGAQPGARAPEWQPITGTGWAFTVPPDWRNIQPPQSSQAGTMIVSFVSAPPTARGNFPNVNLVLEPYGGPDAAAYGRAALPTVGQYGTIVSSRDVSVGGRAGFDMEVRWVNNQPPTQSIQRVFVSRGFAHILTCSETVEQFPRAAATCQRMLDSFRVR